MYSGNFSNKKYENNRKDCQTNQVCQISSYISWSSIIDWKFMFYLNERVAGLIYFIYDKLRKATTYQVSNVSFWY